MRITLFGLELARDALNLLGYYVLGGYMSPVSNAYKKKVPYFVYEWASLSAYMPDNTCFAFTNYLLVN